MTQTYLTLNNGLQMPTLGFGTMDRKNPDQIPHAVETAIETGYRLFDTAQSYRTERLLAEGIERSGINRKELFLTTKLWLTEYGEEKALKGFEYSLRKLKTDYIDLFLLHWPLPSNFEATLSSYRTLAKLVNEGRLKAVGVANFLPHHLEKLIQETGLTPAINQIEIHPYFTQKNLIDVNSKYKIVSQAWSPLGNSVRMFSKPGEERDPLKEAVLVSLSEKHAKSVGQIVLRWHLQNGVSMIPKSIHQERIKSNFEIFDFELSYDEMKSIDALDTGKRSGPNPDELNERTFDFKLEE